MVSSHLILEVNKLSKLGIHNKLNLCHDLTPNQLDIENIFKQLDNPSLKFQFMNKFQGRT